MCTWLAACRAGCSVFFSRVKKLTRGAGVGHRLPPSSRAKTPRSRLITFPWQLFVGRLLLPLSSPVCVAPSSWTSSLGNSPSTPMNDSLVDEPLPSSSTVVAGSFLRKLQLRMQKLLQRTTVSFPRRIVDSHVAADPAGHGRDEDGGCVLRKCFDLSSERIELPANQVLQIHWDVDLRALRRLFRHYHHIQPKRGD